MFLCSRAFTSGAATAEGVASAKQLYRELLKQIKQLPE
jgi:hypothetical protein